MSLPRIEEDLFGVTAEGVEVVRYRLRNANGLMVALITYGATLTELHVPDRRGRLDDVVLGFDRLAGYERESPYFGSTVGRVAFRIADAQFVLDGRRYQLTRNDGPHHLHGGTKGFSWLPWQAELQREENAAAVRFTLHSPHAAEGYPGNLQATAVYRLTDQNELSIEFAAVADRPTPVNLTHHSYFNLAGAGSGDVLDHVVQIDAEDYSATDEATIATGEIVPVKNTPFDFRQPTPIGARTEGLAATGGGYDLAYLHRGCRGSLCRLATVYEPQCGRVMHVETTEPAIVFYTGNYLDGSLRGKGGAVYAKHAGFCLEPGGLPDAVNHPSFPSVILRPGQTYRHTCLYRFSTK